MRIEQNKSVDFNLTGRHFIYTGFAFYQNPQSTFEK